MNSKKKIKGCTKITEVIHLKEKEKHICVEEKSHFGRLLGHDFSRKGV